jgi:hypothetical protein
MRRQKYPLKFVVVGSGGLLLCRGPETGRRGRAQSCCTVSESLAQPRKCRDLTVQGRPSARTSLLHMEARPGGPDEIAPSRKKTHGPARAQSRTAGATRISPALLRALHQDLAVRGPGLQSLRELGRGAPGGLRRGAPGRAGPEPPSRPPAGRRCPPPAPPARRA